MSFSELGLNPIVLKCLETTGYTEPTQVQLEAVPAALAGSDLLVSSHTGSGKTAAFLLPSLHKLAEPSQLPGVGPRLLVLTPTRELALQVQKQAAIYGAGIKKLRTVCLVGGAPFGPQFQAMRFNPEVMIATPGRLIDHIERGRIDFSRLEVLVLDEADRMLDMGFIEDIEHIVSRTPASRQTLLFSATLDGMVGKLAMNMTKSPKRIEVATREEHKANIDQRLLFTDDVGHKRRLLDVLLRDVELTQAVIFTATKQSADDLSESLLEQGHSAAALHGDMPQHKRNRTLQRLRDGQIRMLVATDVAARGIDVAGISHVINFDAPRQAEDYVHRIGRTGRAGRTGIAVTFIAGRERGLVRDIERYTGQAVRVDVIAGHEPTARPERSFSKPRSGGGKDWNNKPRGNSYGGGGGNSSGGGGGGSNGGGGYQGRGQGNSFGAPRRGNDDNRGNSFAAPTGNGYPERSGYPERGGYANRDVNGNTGGGYADRGDRGDRGNSNGGGGGWQGKSDSRPSWNKPDARSAAAKPAHSWDRAEKSSGWSKPDARPAYKATPHSQNDDHRPAASKPRGRQSW
jgi:superfamily II DNA/RNA helicase